MIVVYMYVIYCRYVLYCRSPYAPNGNINNVGHDAFRWPSLPRSVEEEKITHAIITLLLRLS